MSTDKSDMTLWAPHVDDLAGFTGEIGASYSEFVQTALSQATTLFEWASCIEVMPESGSKEEALVKNAVLSMADAIYLGKEFRGARVSPFQSESIGSYSYSKAQNAVLTGIPTGIGWFDMAVEFLGVCVKSRNAVMGTARTLFEDDMDYHTHSDGRIHLLGPADLTSPFPPYWYSTNAPYNADNYGG